MSLDELINIGRNYSIIKGKLKYEMSNLKNYLNFKVASLSLGLILGYGNIANAQLNCDFDPTVNAPISTNASVQLSPAVAYDGVNYLVVWQDNRSGNYDIYGQFMNLDDSPVGGNFPIAGGSGNQWTPDIAFDGVNYLIVYQDTNSNNIRGQRVDTSGSLVGSAIIISSGSAPQQNPSVDYGNGKYFVVYEDDEGGSNYDVDGTFVNPDGSLGVTVPITTAGGLEYYPKSAFDGINYLIVWEDRNSGQNIYGQFVDSSGMLVGVNFPISNLPDSETWPDIAFDGINYLVVWTDRRNDLGDIYGRLVDTSGTLVGSEIPILTISATQYSPVVDFDGINYLVVWTDERAGSSNIYGQFVDTSGILVDSEIPICTAVNPQNWPEISFDGNNYFVVWQDSRVGGGNYDIYGQIICGSDSCRNPIIVLSDDMESGEGNWSHYADQGNDDWAILNFVNANSPVNSWFTRDVKIVKDAFLVSEPFRVDSNSELIFWHTHEFEELLGKFYDGAVIEISYNGGLTWYDLGPYITQGGYNGVIATGYSNPISGRMAWVDGTIGTMTQVKVDLSSFFGIDRRIRFRIACDESQSAHGWYIDDVQITGDCNRVGAMSKFGVASLATLLLGLGIRNSRKGLESKVF